LARAGRRAVRVVAQRRPPRGGEPPYQLRQERMHRQRSSRVGRGLNAVRTDAGLARLRRAWRTHLATVRRHMMDDLSELDLPAVTAALQRFASDFPVGSRPSG
jgi:hypothetical protein